MPSFASITIVGHLGKDPELRQVGENQVCGVSIAVSEKVKGEDQTSWYDLNIWNKQAETFAKYLHKGDVVMIIGRPRIEQYTCKDGTQKTKVSVRVSEFTMLGGKKDGRDMIQGETRQAQAGTPAASVYVASKQDEESQPPF